jgi:hypothetical protein
MTKPCGKGGSGAARESHRRRGMSHRSVEVIIGRLATDESFRRRFVADAPGVLERLRRCGYELTAVEIEALSALDLAGVDRFADAIDRRLQKIDFGSA